jgi:hypothetical protein
MCDIEDKRNADTTIVLDARASTFAGPAVEHARETL